MRHVTITKTPAEKQKPLTVGDLKRGAYFQFKNRWPGEWFIRTTLDSTNSAVTLNDGVVVTGFLGDEVGRVLLDNESITFGPEVKDGEDNDEQ